MPTTGVTERTGIHLVVGCLDPWGLFPLCNLIAHGREMHQLVCCAAKQADGSRLSAAMPPGMQPSVALACAEPAHGDMLSCIWTSCPAHLSTLLSLQVMPTDHKSSLLQTSLLFIIIITIIFVLVIIGIVIVVMTITVTNMSQLCSTHALAATPWGSLLAWNGRQAMTRSQGHSVGWVYEL